MQPLSTELEPYLQQQVDAGSSGLDILHGHLKTLMLEAEAELVEKQQLELDNDYSDALDSMERKYWEGVLDGYSELYNLTYLLSFAIAERDQI